MKALRNTRAPRLWLAAWLAGTCCACSKVGAPLVDHQPLPDGGSIARLTCPEPPGCEQAWIDGRIPDEPPMPAPVSRVDCAQIPLAVPLAVPLADGASVSCQQIKLSPDDFGDARALSLRDVSLHNVDIEIAASDPLELALDRASLHEVFVSLVGPVRLQITAPVEFSGVRVMGEAQNGAKPSLELGAIPEGQLSAGAQEQPFNGSLSLTRSVLSKSQLIADQLVLESVVLTNTAIVAHDLRASDADFQITRLSTEQALLSACELSHSVIDRCGSLTVISSALSDVLLPPCESPPARFYSSKALRVVADGEIETDRSTWSGSVLGFRAPTKLINWTAEFSSVSFCEHADTAMFVGSIVQCSSCVSRDDDPFCVSPDYPGKIDANYCSALFDPPVCVDPIPERTRPMRGY